MDRLWRTPLRAYLAIFYLCASDRAHGRRESVDLLESSLETWFAEEQRKGHGRMRAVLRTVEAHVGELSPLALAGKTHTDAIGSGGLRVPEFAVLALTGAFAALAWATRGDSAPAQVGLGFAVLASGAFMLLSGLGALRRQVSWAAVVAAVAIGAVPQVGVDAGSAVHLPLVGILGVLLAAPSISGHGLRAIPSVILIVGAAFLWGEGPSRVDAMSDEGSSGVFGFWYLANLTIRFALVGVGLQLLGRRRANPVET